MRRRKVRAPPPGTVKINAPRLSTKAVRWFEKDSEDFAPEYYKTNRDIGVCYDLVKIASFVLKRPILLKVGTEEDGIRGAATDGKTIFLPRMHPQRRIALKHEISHLYFKSNIPLRLLFVRDLISQIERETGGVVHGRSDVESQLCFIINVFDDLRVNSLWGLLYPGDGRDMERWYQGDVGPRMMKKATEDYPGGDVDHLMSYIILVSLGQKPKSTRWGKFQQDIEIAAGNVAFKTFGACLLLVKDLLLKIVRELMGEQQPSPSNQPSVNPTDRPDDDPELQAADKETGGGDQSPDPDVDQLIQTKLGRGPQVLSALLSGNRPDADFIDDNAGFDFKREELAADAGHHKRLMSEVENLSSEQDLDSALQKMEQAAVEEVTEIQRALAERSNDLDKGEKTEGAWLKKSAKFDLKLHYVKESELQPTLFTRKDMESAQLWKRFFQRILGSLAHKTDEVGYELIPDLYIQQKASGETLDCYRVESRGRGFRVNILVDMSGSMSGVFDLVEKLSRALQVALSFPFVKLGVWGFSSRAGGQVDIYKFPRNSPGLLGGIAALGGTTPLPQAIQVVGRDLLLSRDDNHLIVLTDGDPVFHTKSGKNISDKILRNWTREAVQNLQDRQVQTYCFRIGGGSTKFSMDRMFGRNWKTISEGRVYEEAFALIKERFVRYLRVR